MVHPIKSEQDLCVFWKLMNPQDSVWENHCRLMMKTPLQEKEQQFIVALQFGSQIYSYASSQKNPASKAAVDKEWE